MEELASASGATDISDGTLAEDHCLKGFRRRWILSEFRSPEHLSIGSASQHGTPDPDFEEIMNGLGEQPDDDGSWSRVGDSIDYVPSTPGDPVYDDEGRVSVSGSAETEYNWKHTALQSATKRARLYNEQLPWESSDLNGVFGSADLFTGTMASGYNHLFAPVHEGIYDVLQSEMASGTSATSSSETAAPPVRRIVVVGARRETSDEDIRRVALAKLRDLVMGDPAATHLGISLQHLLSEGNASHFIEQSFSDCFRSKASSTLQKRANSLWKLSLIFAELGVLHPLRFSEDELYGALCLLREKGMGATSGQHVIEALHFLDGTAGFSLCNIGVIISGRCRGVARYEETCLYSILLYSTTLVYPTLPYSILFYSILFYSILFYSTLSLFLMNIHPLLSAPPTAEIYMSRMTNSPPIPCGFSRKMRVVPTPPDPLCFLR